MLGVELNQSNMEYDINSLISSFYPQDEVHILTPLMGEGKQKLYRDYVKIQIELHEPTATLHTADTSFTWIYDRTQEGMELTYKEGVKRFLYRTLRTLTGKDLPWGCLTGIRPTKLAYAMLEEGLTQSTIENTLSHKYYVSDPKISLSIRIAQKERAIAARLPSKEDTYSALRTGYSLYIGIPFCPTTCLYCSFLSQPISSSRVQAKQYVESLLREARATAKLVHGEAPTCIYIGGGTPTALDEESLEMLLRGVREIFDCTTLQEFTVESGRADSITREKLQILNRFGVDRICVNPQTMNQSTLDLIGRRHTPDQVKEAFQLAREVGFTNINMDVITGLPGEGQTQIQHTMEAIAQLRPDSLTVHSLAIKRASRMKEWVKDNTGEIRNTEAMMNVFAMGAEELGMEPYYLYRQKNMAGNFENTGYAVPGKECLYNIFIMEEKQTIFALGAGTITKFVSEGKIVRQENAKDLELYQKQIDETTEKRKILLSTI
ncbi:MAG: coproporphyrinogen dehydrogenase HemZ [Lachnospiraceae bacterium]|jgi:oxygen-independent coproporphyrinogen-3 oxidase|nr:coproporphyrinogen dehydrogenase HemZ [Lachnospiraceae bacterium]